MRETEMLEPTHTFEHIEVLGQAGWYSWNEEIYRLLFTDAYLFAAALLIMMMYVGFTLGSCSCTGSRVLLGMLSAFFNMAFAVGFSFGAVSLMGIKLNQICFFVPFIILGTAVDDMVVVTTFFDMNSRIPGQVRRPSTETV